MEELATAGEYQEALDNLQRLYDGAEGRIVQRGGMQSASTLNVKVYQPLQAWSQAKLLELLTGNQDLRARFELGQGAKAKTKLANATAQTELSEVAESAMRYSATSSGAELSMLLVDFYLERGWGLAALQTMSRVCPDLRRKVPGGKPGETLPWPLIVLNLQSQLSADSSLAAELREIMSTALERSQNDTEAPGVLLAQCLERILWISAIDGKSVDEEAVRLWCRVASPLLPAESQARIEKLLEGLNSTSEQSSVREFVTFAGTNARVPNTNGDASFDVNPKWSQLLERFTANRDVTDASQPRVGESTRGTLFCFPVVAGGRIYINTLTGIEAFDLASGRSWPSSRPGTRLFDSGSRIGAYLPVGYPLLGVPRGTLSLADDCLYGRLGKPVTGWANGETAADGGSESFLVGLDLKRQGSLLKGFPLRLTPPRFSGVEFEGAPLVFGNWIIVALVARDNVGVQRRVAAFDRFDGRLIWESPVLAAGSVQGSDQAHLISHQLLTEAGGRVFYNTNLGSVACLDPLNGQIVWLAEYERVAIEKQAVPAVDRYRYRDLSPCMVDAGLVYCAPQDCPEVFALDAITGDLVWSTDSYQAADTTQLLGVQDRSLLLSGDRLVWLDKLTGRVLSRFPQSTTPGRLNALPSPRGLGRGATFGGRVFWPTAGEIFVFAATQTGSGSGEIPSSPQILQRIKLGSRGKEGGNLTISNGHLIINTPSSMIIFRGK